MMGTTCRLCDASTEEQTFCSSCQRSLDANPEGWVSQTLGSHQIQHFLGEGPIGMVFDALHTPSGERVRLKIIDSEILVKETALIDQANQLIVGSTGLHDSLPELMEVDLEHSEVRFLSVQWVEGQTLRERLNQGPLQEVEACLLIAGVLAALDALHSAGLSHRDLKPENILLGSAEGPGTVHILDVGPSVFSAKARLGAHYRSPEQARGSELIGPETDIYACGAILYEALSGRRPFDSSDFDVLMSQISLRRPPPLGQHCPHLSPGLLQVVSKSMEPMPDNRYPSAVEMLRAVRAFVSEQERPSLPERLIAIPQAQAQESPAAAAQPAPDAAPAPAPGSMLARDDLPPAPSRGGVPAENAAFHFEVDEEAPTIRQPSPIEEAPKQPQTGGSGKKIAAIVFLIIAFIAGGGLLYYTVWSRQEVEPVASENQVDAGTTTHDTTPTKSHGTISVKLNGLPQKAVFFVDGRRLGANPFRAPKSPAVHKIRVEAPNHEPFETEVSFGENQEIAVEMTPTGPDESIGQIKAHTKGLRANQRSWKRGPIKLSIKRTKTGPSPDKAPDQLRQRDSTTPH